MDGILRRMTNSIEKNDQFKYTLLYKGLAEEGYQFVFVGKTSECDNCRLTGVCLANLEPGRLYEVTSVRDVVHNCAVHDQVVTVTVHEPQLSVAVSTKNALQGSTITWKGAECKKYQCKYYRSLCHPEYIMDGDRLQIKNKLKKIKCPNKQKLTNVKVSRTK